MSFRRRIEVVDACAASPIVTLPPATIGPASVIVPPAPEVVMATVPLALTPLRSAAVPAATLSEPMPAPSGPARSRLSATALAVDSIRTAPAVTRCSAVMLPAASSVIVALPA